MAIDVSGKSTSDQKDIQKQPSVLPSHDADCYNGGVRCGQNEACVRGTGNTYYVRILLLFSIYFCILKLKYKLSNHSFLKKKKIVARMIIYSLVSSSSSCFLTI